jgi:hypothetical protein
VITLGIVLLVVGYLTGVQSILILGIVVVGLGLALAVAGTAGHAVAGRPHWF